MDIGINTVAYHPNTRGVETVAVVPGAYVRAVLDEHVGLVVGAYHNSYGRISAHTGVSVDAGPLGVYAGALSGYGHPMLFIAPSLVFRPEWVDLPGPAVRVTFLPGAVGLSFECRVQW
jgi:hypothetical protein